jgi:hypothetical protein
MGAAAGSAAVPRDEMKKSNDKHRSIPHWFLESLDASQQAEGALRYVLLELRHILQTGDLDPTLRSQLEGFQMALEQATGRLTILQTGAKEALDRFLDQSGDAGLGEDKGRVPRS